MGNGNDTQNNNTQNDNTQNNNTQNNNTQNNNNQNNNPQGSGPGNNQNKKKGKFSGLGDGIKNSSAFKELGKTALIALIGVIILATVSGGFYRVDEQESAVVTMFGNVIRTDTAGLYFKIPWIQQVTKVDTTIHGTGIGYAVNDDGQSFTVDTEGIMITSDFNLIDIDFYMEYRQNIGLQVVNITVQDAEPPTDEIVREFKAVETAKQGKDTAINNANKYRNQQIPAAEANADKIVQSAEAGKAARIAEAEGQVARFNEMYEQYAVNPLITKQRLFYETMEEVLPGLKVVISDGGTQTVYPIESFSTITGSSAEAEGN